MNLRLLIVDDHMLLRRGCIEVLKNQQPEWEFFEAANGIEAISKARELRPDIILMDYLMPRLNGVRAAIEIRKQFPKIRIIMLSMGMNEELVLKTIDAGVMGFVSKNSPEHELQDAIRKVMNDKLYLTEQFMDTAWKQNILDRKKKTRNGNLFSPRENEVLEMIIRGFKSAEIAEKLTISKRTVDQHRRHLLEKTGAHTSAALVRFVLNRKMGVG